MNGIAKALSGLGGLPYEQYAMSPREIGKVLGISRQAVEKIERRALRKLALAFGPELELMNETAEYLIDRRSERNQGHGIIRL